MISSVCVFCSSSDRIDRSHFAVAEELGESLARRKITLVYGGGGIGLMGALARAASRESGRIVGVIPEFMRARELAFEDVDEMVITTTMRERKAEMEARANAFIVLPGGFGTLEEVVEIITLKQLDLHHKPIIFLNHQNFFDPLLAFFERMFAEEFARPVYKKFYAVADSVESAFHYLENYRPETMENTWYN